MTKLNAAGTAPLIYSTYVGGSAFEDGLGIAVDASGSAYVTGLTDSTNFPTTLFAFSPTANGSRDGFVTKLDGSGSTLVYSTYLGGSAPDGTSGIVVDTAGIADVSGATESMNFPTTPELSIPPTTAVAMYFEQSLNAAGSAPAGSTYLGGSNFEVTRRIAIDTAGHAWSCVVHKLNELSDDVGDVRLDVQWGCGRLRDGNLHMGACDPATIPSDGNACTTDACNTKHRR